MQNITTKACNTHIKYIKTPDYMSCKCHVSRKQKSSRDFLLALKALPDIDAGLNKTKGLGTGGTVLTKKTLVFSITRIYKIWTFKFKVLQNSLLIFSDTWDLEKHTKFANGKCHFQMVQEIIHATPYGIIDVLLFIQSMDMTPVITKKVHQLVQNFKSFSKYSIINLLKHLYGAQEI
ncbi:hypothetical protein ACJX0J_023308, partial [Zea mays]